MSQVMKARQELEQKTSKLEKDLDRLKGGIQGKVQRADQIIDKVKRPLRLAYQIRKLPKPLWAVAVVGGFAYWYFNYRRSTAYLRTESKLEMA